MRKGLEITISIVMALFPALSVYILLPGTSLAFFLLWLCFVPILLIRKNNVCYGRDEVQFLICVVLVSVISALFHLMQGTEWFDFVLFYHNLYSIILCLIPLCFISSIINVNVFVKTVLIFGVIASLILDWQWLSYFFTGSFQRDVFIPGLEINRDLDTFSKFRPSSFFTEPAHFAIYILPAFQLALIKKKNFLTYLFAFSILFSGSSTGLILMFILLGLYLYETGTKRWYVALIGFMVLLISLYVAYRLVPEAFLNNLEKLEAVETGKSDSRLLRPLEYLRLFQSYEHFFGISLNQLSNLLEMDGTWYFTKNYANAAIYTYISFGLTGLAALVIYIIKKWHHIISSYGFLLIFLGIVCSDQILFNGHYFYLVIFVLLSNEILKKEKESDREELGK